MVAPDPVLADALPYLSNSGISDMYIIRLSAWPVSEAWTFFAEEQRTRA